MKRTSKTKGTVPAESIARLADKGADVSNYFARMVPFLTHEVMLSVFIISKVPASLLHSRFGNHQWIGFHLSSIKNTRSLDAALIRVDYVLLAFRESDVDAEAAGLLHFFFLHLRHTVSGKIQPFARTQNSVLRFVISHGGLQAFFNQSVSEQAMTEL